MRSLARAVLWMAVAASCSKRAENESGAPAAAPDAATTPSAMESPFGFDASRVPPEALENFSEGLRALHAFWYEEASRRFTAAIAADSNFSMAYWGLAMSKAKLLWGDDDRAAGRRALERMAAGKLTPREVAWGNAAVALFGDGNVPETRRAFAAAMQRVFAAHPSDESAAFLAVALVASIRPGDPDEKTVRQRAANLAAEVFKRNPQHAGAAHYLIHAADTVEMAPQALAAAQTFAQIAPAAFHAHHMPAHIFSRLGRWKEAIASCQAAWDVSVDWVQREQLSPDQLDFHSLNWLVEMNFELGRRKQADAAMKIYADAVRKGLSHEQRNGYASQVSSYLVRTGEWKRVDELLAPLFEARAVDDPSVGSGSCGGHGPSPIDPPMDVFEKTTVIGARLRAATRLRDKKKTDASLNELVPLQKRMREFLVASGDADAAAIFDSKNRLSREIALARARGDGVTLLEKLRAMAASEKLDFEEGVLGGYLVEEDIADELFRQKKPSEALEAYSNVLKKYPGRAHSILGIARSASAAGDATTSRQWYQKLLDQWSEADPETDGLAEAHNMVSKVE